MQENPYSKLKILHRNIRFRAAKLCYVVLYTDSQTKQRTLVYMSIKSYTQKRVCAPNSDLIQFLFLTGTSTQYPHQFQHPCTEPLLAPTMLSLLKFSLFYFIARTKIPLSQITKVRKSSIYCLWGQVQENS